MFNQHKRQTGVNEFVNSSNLAFDICFLFGCTLVIHFGIPGFQLSKNLLSQVWHWFGLNFENKKLFTFYRLPKKFWNMAWYESTDYTDKVKEAYYSILKPFMTQDTMSLNESEQNRLKGTLITVSHTLTEGNIVPALEFILVSLNISKISRNINKNCEK